MKLSKKSRNYLRDVRKRESLRQIRQDCRDANISPEETRTFLRDEIRGFRLSPNPSVIAELFTSLTTLFTRSYYAIDKPQGELRSRNYSATKREIYRSLLKHLRAPLWQVKHTAQAKRAQMGRGEMPRSYACNAWDLPELIYDI